jgi:glycosyltransferase involved in cell wall biosynthesis
MIALVMVSRLTDEMKARGITDAIRAVDHLDDPRVRLVLVGTGDAEERLRSIAEEVNARHRRTSIIFPGPLSDPRPAYDAADIVVGMGSSAGRGLAFGKPLVVVGEYGWSAIFREPDTDAIFRNSFWSSQEVADGAGLMTRHLRELVENPSERARLAVGARRFAETNFGLPAMALRLAGVYEDAVRSASARAWIGDLRMEARILAAKLERSGRRLVPGGPAGGRISAALTWEHRRQDEMPIAKEPVR